MAKIKHRIEYLFARGMVTLVNKLSEKNADRFARNVGKLSYTLMTSRKEIAEHNLKEALGDSLSALQRKEISSLVFQNIAQTFVELARFEKFGHERLNETVQPDGLEYFKEAHESGNGAIIVTSHFGNWELGAAWVVSQRFPLDVVAKVQSNQLVDELITSLREKTGGNIIPVKSSTLREIVKALKDNRFVAMVADQHDPSGNLILDFFGRKASVAKGPATFARKQNCPLLPFMNRRIKYNSYQILAYPPIYPDLSIDEESDVIRMTNIYLRFFEDVIRQHPEQWMWTHRRWKI